MKLSAVLLVALVSLVPMQAQSQESGWLKREIGYGRYSEDGYYRRGDGRYCREDGRCYRAYRPARRIRHYRDRDRDDRDGTRVYGYSRRDWGANEEVTCRDTRRAVGDQHLSVDGAKKAANDAWAGTVRFHLGEKYMDLSNARQVTYTCSRSSIKEGGVTTLGQTLTRCEVEAQPCHAPRSAEGSDK